MTFDPFFQIVDLFHELVGPAGERFGERFLDLLAAPTKAIGELLKVIVVHRISLNLQQLVACKPTAAHTETDETALGYTFGGVQRRRLLFVSTDRTAASFLEHRLSPEFEVHAAATGEAAFALMDAYAYACVIVDRRTRTMTGIEIPAIMRTVITVDSDSAVDDLVAQVRRLCGDD